MPIMASTVEERMSTSRVVTFRIPEDQIAALETVARFDGVALAEELREGVELLLAARRDDPEFLERVRDSFEQARAILEGVEGGEAVIEALRPRTALEADQSVAAVEDIPAHA
jgi:hypothetical protein